MAWAGDSGTRGVTAIHRHLEDMYQFDMAARLEAPQRRASPGRHAEADSWWSGVDNFAGQIKRVEVNE